MSLLEPGLDMLLGLTGRPTYGVLPFAHGLGIDEEDGLRVSLRGTVRESVVAPPHGEDILRVAVCAVPLMSNFTDVDALAAEPGVVVRFVDRPEELTDADLVIVPGTRGTVKALAWLRERGLADALLRRAAEGRPVLGICGGYQILGEHIEDEVESRAGQVDALGLLPVRVRFDREKTLARPVGEALGAPVEGYEIHHGVADVRGGEPFLTDGQGQRLDGCRSGAVWGTHWHGSLESDAFRRRFLTEIARAAGAASSPPPTPASPHCARSSSTSSVTSSRNTRTPTRCGGSSSRARPRTPLHPAGGAHGARMNVLRARLRMGPWRSPLGRGAKQQFH